MVSAYPLPPSPPLSLAPPPTLSLSKGMCQGVMALVYRSCAPRGVSCSAWSLNACTEFWGTHHQILGPRPKDM